MDPNYKDSEKSKNDKSKYSITEIESLSQLEDLLSDNNKLVVIDFYGSRCPPCKRFAVEYEKFVSTFHEKYSSSNNVSFCKLNANDDKFDNFVRKRGITGLPTILFLKDRTVKEKLVGFPNKFKETIEPYLKRR